MTAATLDRPYRGPDRPVGVPLPPERLPLFRSGQLRKNWQYVSFWSRELSFCAARANVGPLRKEYWGVWDRASGRFRQGVHLFTRRVQIEPNRVYVRDGDTEIDVSFEDCSSFEVYRPADHAYIWSRKDYCRDARGVIRHDGTERAVSGVMFVDVTTPATTRELRTGAGPPALGWIRTAGSSPSTRSPAFTMARNAASGPYGWMEKNAK